MTVKRHVILHLFCSQLLIPPFQDILFQFPKDSASKKVVSLRGIFLTLGDLLSSVTGSTAKR